MALTLLITALTLVACIAVGSLAGWWLHKFYMVKSSADPEETRDTERLTDAIAFVGGAFGILLGLLLVLAVQHFIDARQSGREEAVAVVGLYSALEPFDPESREEVRGTLVCYVESIIRDDWNAAALGDLTGSENVNVYAQELQRGVSSLPQDNLAEETVAYFVQDSMQQLVSARELRLLYVLPEIPALVWLVIYASALVFVALMVFHLGGRRRLALIAVGSTTLVLVVMVCVMRLLDSPFTGPARIEPVSARGSLHILRDTNPSLPQASDCPRLAREVDDRAAP